ncbi:MAG: hypothetical protein M3Y13_08415 [Armatimonadota bacterium]|nr:hypothetical protein [Armatimonadota bacterium]
MIRFGIVLGTVLAIAGLTLAHQYGAALVVGIVVGACFLLRGMAAGGSLGNARRFEKKPADVNARIGTCLGAAGIASESLGFARFPFSFHVFYGACLVVASVGAVVLAWRTQRDAGGK